MYEVKVSENKISWCLPDSVRGDDNRTCVNATYGRLFLPWYYASLAAGSGVVFLVLREQYAPLSPRIRFVGWMALALFALANLAIGVAFSNVSARMGVRFAITRKGVGGISWRAVNWWRIVSGEAFPDFGVIEVEVKWFFGRRTLVRRFGFDRTETQRRNASRLPPPGRPGEGIGVLRVPLLY